MSVSIGNWELNRGPNSILVSTQNENGVAGKNVKLTKKDHLVTRPLLRFPGFFSFFSGPFKVVFYKYCVEPSLLGKAQHAHLGPTLFIDEMTSNTKINKKGVNNTKNNIKRIKDTSLRQT